MRNLAIDIGNTRIKMGVFSNEELLEVVVEPTLENLEQRLKSWDIDNIITSSVREGIKSRLSHQNPDVNKVFLDSATAVPIKNLYHTPETLGMDRLAAVIGARTISKENASLVIDAGTSITFDLIDADGNYQGGGISPGIDLRFKSLNDYTSKLPLIDDKVTDTPLVGKTTEMSIRSGVLNGVTAEIEGIIGRYGDKFPNLKVLICGGDATFFESTIKATIFVVPHLVLIGLNRILLHHAES